MTGIIFDNHSELLNVLLLCLKGPQGLLFEKHINLSRASLKTRSVLKTCHFISDTSEKINFLQFLQVQPLSVKLIKKTLKKFIFLDKWIFLTSKLFEFREKSSSSFFFLSFSDPGFAADWDAKRGNGYYKVSQLFELQAVRGFLSLESVPNGPEWAFVVFGGSFLAYFWGHFGSHEFIEFFRYLFWGFFGFVWPLGVSLLFLAILGIFFIFLRSSWTTNSDKT